MLVSLLLSVGVSLVSAEPELRWPRDFQVVQRSSKSGGSVPIQGILPAGAKRIEARAIAGKASGEWSRLETVVTGGLFAAKLDLPAGGWYAVEVRASSDEKEVARWRVEHVGIGEVFVVAGQSNSANHGAERLRPKSGLVSTFDGKSWRIADDPQPGASGNGGSFLPALGDLIVEKLGVPVGFVSRGVGATSVREWLPKGETFPNPPTIEGNVVKRPDGRWESKGLIFDRFVDTLKSLKGNGVRAVLWHQGESDANQKDASRTFEGKLYREAMIVLIRESGRAAGIAPPWFTAQVSYHVPGDEASPDIRAAQASLWKDGIALEGPDSDSLKGENRDSNGKGVHFSGPGLREHARLWAEKIVPWIESRP